MWFWPIAGRYARVIVTALPDYAELIVAITGTYAFIIVIRLRRALIEQRSRSWLATTPIPERYRRQFEHRSLVIWITSRVLVGLVAAALVVYSADAFDMRVYLGFALILVSLVSGAVFGWGYVNSILAEVLARLVRRRQMGHRYAVHGTGERALQRMAMVRVRNHSTGRHMATAFLPIFLLLPGGIGPGDTLAVLGLWFG